MQAPPALPSPDNPEAALAAVVALRLMADRLEAAAGAAGLGAPLPQAPALAPPAPGLYRAQPSGQEVVQTLARYRKSRGGPLLSAHVVAAVATMPHGVAARTLRAMGVDADQLVAAAQAQVSTATATATGTAD